MLDNYEKQFIEINVYLKNVEAVTLFKIMDSLKIAFETYVQTFYRFCENNSQSACTLSRKLQ